MRVGTVGTGQKVQKWAVFKHLNSAVGLYTLQNFEYGPSSCKCSERAEVTECGIILE
jgi:hypothetical protein